MKYRSEIDGLRSIAVLPVIFFHAGFSTFSGGYVGVDVFFVISGYLITTILIDQISTGKFSIVDFYERRARRILPALFFVMLCTIPFAWLWMIPQQFKDFSQALVAISFFVSNILFWRKEDYFAPSAEENPMLHTWSLAVEEQFYIFFPILLLILWRFGKNPVFYAVVLLSFLSLLLAEYGWRNNPTANFYLLPTRAWELGVGAICAFLLHGKTAKPNQLLSVLGLLMIAYSVFAFDETVPFPSVYALVPVIGTALIILFGGKGTLIEKLLSTKVLVGVGLVSFSAYLWHQPLFAFARIRGLDIESATLMLSLSAASILLAFFSWRYVEQPFRKKGGAVSTASRFSRKQVFGMAAVFSIGFIGFGLKGHYSNGYFDLFMERNPSIAQTYMLIDSAKSRESQSLLLSPCKFRSTNLMDEHERFMECSDKYGLATMVIGDSHSIDLFNGLIQVDFSPFIVGSVSGGCRPHQDRGVTKNCQYEGVLEFLKQHGDKVDRVYYTQAGFHLLERVEGQSVVVGRNIFRRAGNAIAEGSVNVVYEDLVKVSEYLESLTEFVDVAWVGPRVEPHISDLDILQKGCSAQFLLREGQEEIFNNLSLAIESLSSSYSYSFINQISKVSFDMENDFINCDVWFWRDGDHWSLYGAKEFTSRLFK